MPDFLGSFTLFGMAAVPTAIVVVQGIKAVAEQVNKPLSPIAQVVTVVIVAWVLLGMMALVQYMPASEPYVKYALAGILLPLAAMGLYSGGKDAVQAVIGSKP